MANKCKGGLFKFENLEFTKCLKTNKTYWCEICLECIEEHEELLDYIYHDIVIAGTCKLVGCKHHKKHKTGRYAGDIHEYPCKIIELQ